MKFKASIGFKNKNIENLHKIFKVEQTETINNRANWTLTKIDEEIIFDIKAKDSVALRAVLNSITKLLTVYEKMEKI
jgi:tRNA threonylcarbamoyladenosine modification (KEOPS) complex  Pcc1 subunit